MRGITFGITLLLLTSLACAPFKSKSRGMYQNESTQPESPAGTGPTLGFDGLDLDTRRCQALSLIDQAWPVTQQAGDAARGWVRLQRDWAEANYQDKVTAIFAGIEHCGFDPARVSEANGLLRYSMFEKWPSQNGTVWFNSDAAWNHANLGRGFRLFFLYRNQLATDLRNEFDLRIQKQAWGGPATTQTENINLMINTAHHLAAQFMGSSSSADAVLVRNWLIEELHIMLEHGFWEFGSNYMAFTYSALLNLADFAEDAEIRRLAWAALDYLQIQQAELSLGNNFAGPAVRQYEWGATIDLRRIQTVAQDLYFGTFRPLTFAGSISDAPAFMIANNYQPLELTGQILADNAHLEVKSTTGSFNGIGSGDNLAVHRQYMYSGQDFALGVLQRFQDEGMAHHNFVNVVVQSRAHHSGWVVPWSFPEGHQVSAHHRSFGYKNVAFMQDGGNGYDGGEILPAKIYAHSSFTTVDIQQCYAFLTDGVTYVAWIPSQGSPVHDGSFGGGFRIRSSVSVDDYWGEAAIFEAGDAEMFGSFENFKQSIRQRVGGCPRWSSGQLHWTAKDGTDLVFTKGSARVNGVTQDYSSYSRLQSRHTNGTTVAAGGSSVTFDLANGYHTGDLQHVTQTKFFGARAPYPPLPEPCVASETRLCLGADDRFAVTLDYKLNGVWSAAHMVELAGGESGYAWFFDPQNPEVMLKVLDGRALNQKFWYFHGQLTDLEFRIQVKDSETGAVKTYTNAAGQNRGLADVNALPVTTSDNRAGTCAPSDTVFCSHNGRFATTINWRDFEGHTGVGHLGAQNGVSARAWFFNPSNQELIIKILDGRTLNQNYWIYFGALSNVYYEVHVRDTVTGYEKVYINQSGEQKGLADTMAF